MKTFAELSLKLQELFRPYHAMPVINTLLALDWINAGLDPEKQILPVIEETIARKLKAGHPVPTSLKYYDTVLKGLNKDTQPNIVNENERERDLRLIKQYRWKVETLKGQIDLKAERGIAELQRKYGEGFGE